MPSARLVFALTLLVCPRLAHAQLEFEREPIKYSQSEPNDAITKLVKEIRGGTQTLKRDDEHGYLKPLLSALKIPTSSQTLVFSKTSFQRNRISPRTPRAIYFNDDVYIAWVQRGDAIEISTADPKLGAVFYTLDQNQRTDQPIIERRTDRCLSCHASTHTRRVPGHIMRSVYPDRHGMPIFSFGTHRTTDRSPLSERWGGWYVSGTHGDQRHMGNETTTEDEDASLDIEAGANISDLASRFTSDRYLESTSDIVALMVLAHQVTVHNAITTANFSARRTIRDARIMNEALERDEGYESDSTKSRFSSAAETLVDALLMVKEAKLTSPISGSKDFTEYFESLGPKDVNGRSLRQFDLKTRMFKYPCSFLIYSEAFDALPDRLKTDVYRKLFDVLAGENDDTKYDHLSVEDRNAVREILIATKTNLPTR